MVSTVPSTPARSPADALDHCEDCRARNTSWTTVRLRCVNGSTVLKAVEVVAACACALCERQRARPQLVDARRASAGWRGEQGGEKAEVGRRWESTTVESPEVEVDEEKEERKEEKEAQLKEEDFRRLSRRIFMRLTR